MKSLRYFTAICVLLFLAACHESGPFECVDWDGPEFQTDDLPNAVLNQEYEAEIRVQIDNEPRDDLFSYEFDIDGDLPDGLRVYQLGDSRELEIVGTPTESGMFEFEVWVDVSGYTDICYHTAKKTYTLVVDEI